MLKKGVLKYLSNIRTQGLCEKLLKSIVHPNFVKYFKNIFEGVHIPFIAIEKYVTYYRPYCSKLTRILFKLISRQESELRALNKK